MVFVVSVIGVFVVIAAVIILVVVVVVVVVDDYDCFNVAGGRRDWRGRGNGSSTAAEASATASPAGVSAAAPLSVPHAKATRTTRHAEPMGQVRLSKEPDAWPRPSLCSSVSRCPGRHGPSRSPSSIPSMTTPGHLANRRPASS